jgi:hypothetical protein
MKTIFLKEFLKIKTKSSGKLKGIFKSRNSGKFREISNEK